MSMHAEEINKTNTRKPKNVITTVLIDENIYEMDLIIVFSYSDFFLKWDSLGFLRVL